MTPAFYTVLLYSLMLTTGAVLAFYGYRYILGTINQANKNQKPFIRLRSLQEGSLSGKSFLIFDLPEERDITVVIKDLQEKDLKVLHKGVSAAGELALSLETTEFANGEYFLCLNTTDQQIQRKLRIENV